MVLFKYLQAVPGLSFLISTESTQYRVKGPPAALLWSPRASEPLLLLSLLRESTRDSPENRFPLLTETDLSRNMF